jgi:hypothetical protein
MAYVTPGTVAAGDVATAAAWNVVVGDIVAIYQGVQRLAFGTRTTNYSISSTTLAGAADAFASDLTWTADGTSSYRIEAYWPFIESAQATNALVQIWLVDGSGTGLGRLGYVAYADGTRSATQGAFNPSYFYTPAAGSTSINIRIINENGTGNASAGAGGAAANVPAYLAVYGPTIT